MHQSTGPSHPLVVLLGASGYLGSAVLDVLLGVECEVRPVHAPRLTPRPLAQLHEPYTGDAAAREQLTEALSAVDVVINCAGDPEATSPHVERLLAANALLPALVAETVTELGVPRFLHVSSAVVQGRSACLDDSRSYLPGTPYARSKALGEAFVLARSPRAAVVYRPAAVHSPERRVTRRVARFARSPLSTVAAPGRANTPQAHLHNVASAVGHLALTPRTPPAVVSHPSEGLTTASLLSALGGREPRLIPRPVALTALTALRGAGRADPRLSAQVRRLELLWFGQKQAPSWLTGDGWKPVCGTDEWRRMGRTLAEVMP